MGDLRQGEEEEETSTPVLGLICNQSRSRKRDLRCVRGDQVQVLEEPASTCRDRAPVLAKHITSETSSGPSNWAAGSKGWEAEIEPGS